MATPTDDIANTLDQFHAAAAGAHFDEYFSLFAPDGVFLGTDASERWTVSQFKEFAKPRFDKGKGWTYKPHHRQITLAADGQTAWFDELLDNASNGLCRGTGVLRLIDGHWKIEQYSLSVPIPNSILAQTVKLIASPAANK